MIERHENKVSVAFGDDLRDVAEWLRRTPRVWNQRSSQSSGSGYGREWDYGVGYEGAWKLAHEGWSVGAADLHTAVQGIEPDAVLPELKFDMGGEFVDVPRYLGGNPACMGTHGRQTKQRPVVHLVVNMSASASVSAKAFTTYGTALVAVVDAIENAGRRVEIDAVGGCVPHRGGRVLCGWKVKKAEDHLDLAALAFTVAHPAAFRRIVFAMMERSPREYEDYSYGMPITIKEGELTLIGAEGAFILPSIGTSQFGVDPKEAVPRAIKQINDLAGEEIVSAA